jgi:hypothetical protein
MNMDAWLYYGIAAYFLDPVDFLSSPNLDKLQKELDHVKPPTVPGPQQPLMIGGQGSVFQVTSVTPTTTFGALDVEIQYVPDATQTAQLHDAPTARKQATQVMTAMLALHPELRDAFHGMWVHVDQGSVSLVSLELPMDQIAPGAQPTAMNANPTLR